MWRRSQCESLRSRDAIVSVNTEGLEHGANLLPLCCVQTQTRLCFLFLNMSLTGVRGGRVQQYLQRMGGFQCEDNPHVSYVCFWCLREAASACEAVFIASGVCTALVYFVCSWVCAVSSESRRGGFASGISDAAGQEASRCRELWPPPLSDALWTWHCVSDTCLIVYIRCTTLSAKEIINHQNEWWSFSFFLHLVRCAKRNAWATLNVCPAFTANHWRSTGVFALVSVSAADFMKPYPLQWTKTMSDNFVKHASDHIKTTRTVPLHNHVWL